MTVQYANYDGDQNGLVSIAQIIMQAPGDTDIIPSVHVDLQFPPTIKSDSKQANWKEVSMMSSEQLAIYMGAKAKELSIELKYIIDGGQWSAKRIIDQITAIKGVLYKNMAAADKSPPIMRFIYPGLSVGSAPAPSYRVVSNAFKYSDELVLVAGDGGGVVSWFPLETTVTLNVAAQSKAAKEAESREGGGGDDKAAKEALDKDKKTITDQHNIAESVDDGWY